MKYSKIINTKIGVNRSVFSDWSQRGQQLVPPSPVTVGRLATSQVCLHWAWGHEPCTSSDPRCICSCLSGLDPLSHLKRLYPRAARRHNVSVKQNLPASASPIQTQSMCGAVYVCVSVWVCVCVTPFRLFALVRVSTQGAIGSTLKLARYVLLPDTICRVYRPRYREEEVPAVDLTINTCHALLFYMTC